MKLPIYRKTFFIERKTLTKEPATTLKKNRNKKHFSKNKKSNFFFEKQKSPYFCSVVLFLMKKTQTFEKKTLKKKLVKKTLFEKKTIP